jgi:DNA transformation protein
MPRSSEFVEFVVEQMIPIGRLRVRAMFGGYGIYLDDYFIAIIVDDRLYFKADSDTACEFEAKDLNPFSYVTHGKRVTMKYFEAPPEVFEETEVMSLWVKKAYGAAIRARKIRAAK